MALENRTEMEAIINAGGVVLFNGTRYTTVESLPTQEEIDAVYTFGPTGPQGEQGEQGEQGPPGGGIVLKGDWDSGTAYDQYDAVAFDGRFWGAVTANTNSEPSDVNADWVMLSDKGEQGEQGEQGIQGETGETGAGGIVNTVNGIESVDVVLDPDDLDDTSTTHKFVTSAEKTKLSNTSGTNTGDQDLSGLVPNTRTVNGNALSSNVSVTDANLSTSDVTTNDVGTTKHGFAPKAPNDATKFLDGTGAWDTVKDSDLSTSDITTNNVSSTKHGFAPKFPNNTTTFLRGDGTYAAPPASSPVIYRGTNPATISNTTTETSLFASASATAGSLVVAANTLAVGSVIRVRGGINAIKVTGTPTLTWKFKLGSASSWSTSVTPTNTTEQSGHFELDLIVTSATGFHLFGHWYIGTVAGVVSKEPINYGGSSGTLDLTVSNTLDMTGTWSAASTNNYVALDYFTVELL